MKKTGLWYQHDGITPAVDHSHKSDTSSQQHSDTGSLTRTADVRLTVSKEVREHVKLKRFQNAKAKASTLNGDI